MKRTILFAALLLFVGNPLCMKAQESASTKDAVMVLDRHVLSLDSCVQMALRCNKSVQAAHHQANKYSYTREALRSNFFPNIKLTVADVYSTIDGSSTVNMSTPVAQFTAQQLHDAVPFLVRETFQRRIAEQLAAKLEPLDPDIDFKAKNIFSAALTLEQPIYAGGKIVAAHRMGKIGEEMAAKGEQLSREEIVVAVYEGYQLLVKAKEMKMVADRYDSLLTQLSNDVSSAVKHGMASHNDELKVKVKKNDAELKVRQAENGIRLARMNLCQLVGLPLTAVIDVEAADDADFVASLGMETSTAECLVENRTDYQILDLKRQLAEQKVNLERAEFMPQLGLLVQGGVIDGIELVGNKLFNHKPFLNIGAVLSVPIFHACEGRNKIRAAKEEAEQERMEQQNYVEKMNLELQQHANEVDEAVLEMTMHKRNLEQCEENLRISRKSYEVGMEPLSDLLTAQLMWQQSYAELVEARYQVKIKMTRWRKAAGQISF